MARTGQISLVVINDEPGIMQVLLRAFGSQPYELRSYRNAVAALPDFADHPADILLLDWHNPPLDGRDLFARLRHEYPETAIVYVSPHADDIPAALGPTIRPPDLIIESPFVLERVVENVRDLVVRLGFMPELPQHFD